MEGIQAAIANPYQSGVAIAKNLQRQNQQLPQLPQTASMARVFNLHRQKTRPRHPTTLDNFEVNCHFIPDILDTWQLQVGERIHVIWSSKKQRELLSTSKTWYMDGTFRLVKEPFKQLYCIHSFITDGTSIKQVPLLFVLMSGKRTSDYKRLFQVVKKELGTINVTEIVADFEASVWKAITREFPAVRIRGCIFHWTQAVWRNVQQNGLQVPYMKDAATHSYIRRLLALPMLPHEHIAPVFESIRQDTTEALTKLNTYINKYWVHSKVFPPKSWSAFYRTTRTNNDVESWHGALNRRAGKNNLPLYLLAQLLGEEAENVSVEIQLVSDGKLARYQRRAYKKIQGRLFSAWEEYLQRESRNIRDARILLKKVAGIYGPRQ